MLRSAFETMLKDPKVIKDGERQGVRVSPSSWQQIEADIKELSKAPPWIIEEYKKLAGLSSGYREVFRLSAVMVGHDSKSLTFLTSSMLSTRSGNCLVNPPSV